MSRRKLKFFAVGKLVAPAMAVVALITLSTMNACTPSDRSTENREQVMSQNAAEAEAAEAQIAAGDKAGQSTTAQLAQAPGKTADKSAKAASKVASKPAGKTKAIAGKGNENSPSRQVASASRGGVYIVQVGAFKLKENAEKLQAKLKSAGYAVEMQSIEHSKNGVLHLVRTQPVPNKADAEVVVEELHTKQDLTAQIVTLPIQ